MKRKLVILLSILVLISTLTSCGLDVPRPQIKEGRFNISVTYEYNGEIKTASGVYICEYNGILWWDINGEPRVYWKESYEGDLGDDGIVRICNTDDGGEIFISFLLYPEYFMGDPEHTDRTPIIRVELWYPDKQIDDADIIAEYGVKLLDCKYDDPIENVFK